MTQYYVTVFLVGSYLPMLLGTEGVSEEQYFKQIWYNRLEKEYALPVFSQRFSPELVCRMKKGIYSSFLILHLILVGLLPSRSMSTV